MKELSFIKATQMFDTILQANPDFSSSMRQIADINRENVVAIGNSIAQTAERMEMLNQQSLPITRGLGEIAEDKNRSPQEDNLLKMAESCMDKSSFDKAKQQNQSFIEVNEGIKRSIDEKSAEINRRLKLEEKKEVEEDKTQELEDPRIVGVLHAISEQIKEYLSKPVIDLSEEKDREKEKSHQTERTKDQKLQKNNYQEQSQEQLQTMAENLSHNNSKMADIIKGFKVSGCGLDTMKIEEVEIETAIEGGSKAAVGENIDKESVEKTRAEKNEKAFSSSLPPRK